jgi:PAS domain S-box-containing protein
MSSELMARAFRNEHLNRAYCIVRLGFTSTLSRRNARGVAMQNSETRSMTQLLLESRTHHMRATLEELPVGTISVNKNGIIEAIDSWIEKLLGFDARELILRSITTLFEDSAFEFLEMMRKNCQTYLGEIKLRTKAGEPLSAHLALVHGLEPHRITFSVICGTDGLPSVS